MGSEYNAIFVGTNNKLVITHNGGISFDTVSIADASLIDVFFVNATTAFAAGNSIWKTTDAGYTWTKLYDFINPKHGYESLHFINDQIGWIIRYEGLFKTTNGGVDWQAINTGTALKVGYSCNVFFPDDNHGYISDKYSVARCNDAGLTWIKTDTRAAAYHDIHFVSANTGYITDSVYIFKTSDGGVTWNKDVVMSGCSLFELHFTDVNHGWACGTGGIILKFEK